MVTLAEATQPNKTTHTLFAHIVGKGFQSHTFDFDSSECFMAIVSHLRDVFLGSLPSSVEEDNRPISDKVKGYLKTRVTHLVAYYRESGMFSYSEEGFNIMEDEIWAKFCVAFEEAIRFENFLNKAEEQAAT
jgi:hypothetical protein